MTLLSLFLRCTNIEYIHNESGGSYACEKIGKELYIYFQKSYGSTDWKSNLNFPIKRHNGYFAHRGFVNMWNGLRYEIHNIVEKEDWERIIVVGYSHGGALAVLCHEYIYSSFPSLRNSLFGYGFGCPRVLWGFVNKTPWRTFTVIRNLNDLVTHLPPAFFGYSHPSPILKIGKRFKYSMIDAHREENISRELESN